MPEPDDHQLLAIFARTEWEPAFAELVGRHIKLVYSTALRSTGNPHHAEEITQAVFVILARKAGKLSPRVVLSGWLYQAARLTAANFLKTESRRRRREQEVYMQSTLNEPTEAVWKEIAPLLDDAMGRLGQTDRDAIVLRFFENKSAAEIGTVLRMNEETARRRVNRALEKLRKFFAKRGVSSTTAILAGTISVNSVQAAPISLTKAISAVAITKGAAASTSTLTLIKGALKVMAWTKLKSAALAGVGVLLVSGTAIIAVRTMSLATPSPAAEKIWNQYSQAFALNRPKAVNAAVQVMAAHPPMALIRLSPVQHPQRAFGGVGKLAEVGGRQGHVALGAFLVQVLRFAYNLGPQFPQNHIIVPGDLTASRYDFIDTMPHGGREVLRQALKDQFGLVARREMRPNLVMTVKNPTTGGLHKHTDATSASGFRSINVTMPELANAISRYMGVKVTDQTGLAGGFDFNLDVPDPASPTPNDIKKALLDQLGLELTPAADKQRVEFLVVEKMR